MKSRPIPDRVEVRTSFEPIDGYSIGGSVDAVTGDTVTDYKSCSSFTSSIKLQHKFQLLLYAMSLNANGSDIKNIEVVQIKRGDSKGKISEKTGKVIGIKKPEIRVLLEPITQEDIQFVKQHIVLLIETLKTYGKDNSLAGVLFRANVLSYIQE